MARWAIGVALAIAGCGSSHAAVPHGAPRVHAGAVVERPAATRPPPELYIEEGASIQALCARLVGEAGELDDSGGGRGGPALEIRVMAHRQAGGGAPELALLEHTHRDDESDGYILMLAAQVPGGYALFELAEDVEVSESGSTEMGDFRDARIEIVATTTGPVVRASVTHEHSSSFQGCEDGCCASWSLDRSDTVLALCTLDELDCQPLTIAREITRGDSYSREDPNDASSPPCDYPGDDYAPSERDTESWTRSLTIDPDGTTHLRDHTGRPPEHPAPGDRPFAELVRILGAPHP